MGASRRYRAKLRRGAIYVGVDLPDDAPAELKEGIARRRITVLTGCCPCGATPELDIVTEWGERWTAWHEPGCPARDDRMGELLSEWRGDAA